MKHLSFRLFIALLTFIMGVATVGYISPNVQGAPRKHAPPRNTEDENIAEAVFRYKFETFSDGRKFSVYFLWLGDGRDPNDDFMSRFAGNTPPVKKASQSVKVSDGVKDKGTGKRGVIYGIPRIKWLSDTEVDVSVSKWVWGWGQYGYVCRALRENDKWVVKRCELTSAT
jgi:hypothetical protein